MKAVIYERYGPPDVLRLQEIDQPVPLRDELLIKVRATSVTAGDWRMRKAHPFAARIYNGIFRPRKVKILGFDLAGEVVEIGPEVTKFQVGESIFGSCGFGFGAYAEYRCLAEDEVLAKIPAGTSFQEAAAVPYGAIAPLLDLRDQVKIEPGLKVLIIGASGSVGTFAVQLAEHFGARVSAVCSAKNSQLVEDLGAERVFDYRTENYWDAGMQFDLIYDAAGKSSRGQVKSALTEDGKFVSVMKGSRSKPARQQAIQDLAQLFTDQKIHSVIDRTFPLEEITAAHQYVENGKRFGNVIITVNHDR